MTMGPMKALYRINLAYKDGLGERRNFIMERIRQTAFSLINLIW